jgi:ketosteroid isomerase-like protein
METPSELAERLYAAVVEDDPRPFLALCAPDAVIAYPGEGRLPYGGEWRGRSEIEAFLTAHDGAEEILVFEVVDMLESGQSVTVRGRFGGRAKPGSATWSTRFVHLLTFRAGLLERWEACFDTGAAFDAHAR